MTIFDKAKKSFMLIFVGITIIRTLLIVNQLNTNDHEELFISPLKASNTSSHSPSSSETASSKRASSVLHGKSMVTCVTETNETVTLPRNSFPQLILVGAQKAGTTAIYNLLSKVGLRSSKKLEVHFWDGIRDDPGTWSDQKRCTKLNDYWKSWAHSSKDSTNYGSPDSIMFEKTPSLLGLSHIPRYIQSAFQWNESIVDINDLPKILVVLRNPINRAISFHKMAWQQKGSPEPGSFEQLSTKFVFFDQHALQCVDFLRTKNVIQVPPPPVLPPPVNRNRRNMMNATVYTPPQSLTNITYDPNDFQIVPIQERHKIKEMNSIQRGFYAEQLAPYIEVFGSTDSNSKMDRSDKGNKHTHHGDDHRIYRNNKLMAVLYEDFLQNKSGILSNILEFVVGTPDAGYHNLSDLELNMDLGPSKRANKKNAHGGRVFPEPSPQVIEYLKMIYKPVNEQLADLLGEAWRGVWE